MKHTTLKLVTDAMIISATALFVGGCSNKAQDIDLTLIGGDGQDIENRYTVDIRYDTDEAPINSDTAIVISTAEPEEISEPDIPKKPLLRKPHRLQPRQHSRLSPSRPTSRR